MLTDLQSGFQIQNLVVSSDGKQIVFNRQRDNTDVMTMLTSS
jgi:hypothetical protein